MTGEDLRRRRRTLGYSQQQLADRLGVTKNTVARWERGELMIGSPNMLRLAIERLERDPQGGEGHVVTTE